MARKYNPGEYIQGFEGSARTPGFIKQTAANNSDKILQRGQDEQADFKTRQRSSERRASFENSQLNADRSQITANYHQVQAEFAKAKAATGIVKSLAGLSGSLAGKFAQINEIQQQEAAKREQEALNNDFLFGSDGGGLTDATPEGNESLNATVDYSQGQVAAGAAQEQRIRQVAPGMPQVQEDLRAPNANLQAARNQTKLNVHQASAAIGMDLDTYMLSDTLVKLPDGREIRARDARTGAEIAAVAGQGVRTLTAKYGIGRGDPQTARDTYLRAARGAYAGATQRFAAQAREALIKDRERLATDSAMADLQGGPVDMQAFYQNYYQNLRITGTSLSDAELNDKAFNGIVATAESMGERGIEILESLKGVEKVPGNRGTRLGMLKGKEIEAAITRIRNAGTSSYQAQARETAVDLSKLKQEHGQALLKAKTPQEVQQLNEQYEADLRRIAGQPGGEAALKLYQEATLKGDNYNPYAVGMLMGDVEAGNAPTLDELNRLESRGTITADEKKSIAEAAGLSARPVDKTIDGMKTTTEGTVKASLKHIFKSQLGQNPDAGQLNPIAEDIAARVLGAVKRDIPPDASPAEVRAAIDEKTKLALADFRSRTTVQGKSQTAEIHVDENTKQIVGYEFGGSAVNPATVKTFKNPHTGQPARVMYNVPTDQLRKLQTDTNKDNDIKPYSDALISKEDLGVAVEHLRAGRPDLLDERIKAVARAAGITPTSLIYAQGVGQGIDIDALVKQIDPAQPQAQGPTDMRTGALYLQGMGFTERGAAYLAGNIQQESGWNGMRDWGQVAGDGTSRNGGLVSWASWKNSPARLGKVEGFLGKPIDQATHAEQLQAMLWEMKSSYPGAYRTFMNPNASDAQLRRASYEYWGYGHQGKRFDYAGQILQARNQTQPTSSQNTSPLIQGTQSLVGMDTSAGPDRGINACAWAVNKVLASQGIASPWGDDVYVPSIKAKLDQQGKRVSGPVPGAIVIMQDNGNPPYPHIGIVQEDGRIISNSSSRARFDRVETAAQYERYYGKPNLYYVI